MVGALIFLQKIRISPDTAFSVNDWTAFVIFITVIGGIGRIEGPIIGTVIFFLLRQTLADLGAIYLLILGVVAIAVMLKAPKGLWGLIADRFGWQVFPLERRLVIAKALMLHTGGGVCARPGERIFSAQTQRNSPMTQIRSMAQPVPRRPGELGVHSLDHFNFVVPDVAQAEKFYGLFGLNTKEEDGKLALYTHGHPHRWGVVSEGPRKKFTYVSFGAFEDDMPRFRERLEKLRIDRLDPPKGFEFERPLVPRSRRHAGRNPRRREKLAQRRRPPSR